jgi:hypothetical protein
MSSETCASVADDANITAALAASTEKFLENIPFFLPGAPALWPLLAVLRRLDSANWSHMQLF